MSRIFSEAKIIKRDFNLEFNECKCEFEGLLQIDQDDFYYININCLDFPNSFPKVKELGERIPVNINRHIYNDHSCCLTTLPKEQLLLNTKIKSVYSFIKNIVIPFFQNNSYFEINKEYISGEYTHGILGVMESYYEIANINNEKLLVDILLYVIFDFHLYKDEKCFCNSGRLYKECHLPNVIKLSHIDKRVIVHDLNLLFLRRKYINKI